MKTTEIKIGIIGANGKLGNAIIEQAKKEYEVITILRGENFIDKMEQADVWIDASDNALAIEHIKLSTKPILICTTGENNKYENPTVPVMFSPLSSIAFIQICKLLQSLPHWNGIIIDTHLHTKKDAPSGGSKQIMSFMDNVKSHYSFRNNIVGAKMQIILDDTDEMLEISYTTFNRLPYAKGALKLAAWLCQQTPNLYTVENYIQGCE